MALDHQPIYYILGSREEEVRRANTQHLPAKSAPFRQLLHKPHLHFYL
jgi:hypothetical protein